MGQEKHTRRTRFLADTTSQIRVSLLIVFWLLLYTVIMLAVILAPSVLSFTSGNLSPEDQLEASREFIFMDQRVVPYVVLVMLAIGLHIIFITHRIFGPLQRFKRILGEWAGGAWPAPFHGRPRDFHQPLFAAFNETTGVLRRDLESVSADVAFIRERLRPGGTPSAQDARALDEACTRVAAVLDKYRRSAG